MNESASASRKLPLIVHLCLIAGVFVWAGSTFVVRHDRLWERPTFRNEPIEIRRLYDDPNVIDDENLSRVLWMLRPQLRNPQEKINHIDHALRMWGPTAVFDDPNSLTGLEMLEILLDQRKFRQSQGESATSLLQRGKFGLLVRVQEGSSTSSHVDHTLAGLAEIGVPLDYPVVLDDGETSVTEMLRSAVENFSLNQLEYEWSTLAFAEYFEPTRGWYTQEGQKITFDLLAQRIMRQRLVQGVCRGNHRLFTLVMLLRIDEQSSLLSPAIREEVTLYLRDVTDRLMATQRQDGSWGPEWPGIEKEGPSIAPPLSIAEQPDRFLVTGHTLEWWAMAPEELLPPRDVIVNAAQWLSAEIQELTPGELKANYTFLTHAGRALAMWRGKLPAEVTVSPNVRK